MWILNIMDAPSMYPQTSAVRRAKRGMADSRAMEEQHERHNPVNAKGQLMKNYTGMGATPSMGLSQFRGGKKHTLKDHLEHPNMGFGTGAGKKPSEAHMMGQHLSKHIKDLHGAGFWSDFGKGFKDGFTGTLDVLKPATAFIPGFNQVMDAGRSIVGMGHSEGQRAMEMISKKRVGRSRNNGVGLMSGNVDGVRGGANTGAYEGHGHNNLMEGGGRCVGGRRRRPGTPDPEPPSGSDSDDDPKPPHPKSDSDDEDPRPPQPKKPKKPVKVKRMVGAGVRARADLVRKVMAEQGLKMIDASKYVKEHGLY